MRAAALAVCRARPVPLALRRALGRIAVPYSGEAFLLDIDGTPYAGRLDNYIEWVAYVTGQFYEFPYLNLVRAFALGGCALDVGANVGNHAAAFASMFEQVLAFEPYAPLYERLREKTARFGNVEAFNVGLGTADAEMRFAPSSGRNLGKGHVDADGGVPVRIVNGDAFISGKHHHDIRFIKVDVEGFEAEVLKGLAGTIARFRPVVMYEAHRVVDDCFGLFPDDYAFWGLKGQTTVPVQRQVARPVPVKGRDRRFAYVIACPDDRTL